MALSTPSVLTTYVQTTNNDTEWTTASFTPTANGLMIVVIATLDGSTSAPVYSFALAATHTGQGAFTQREVDGPTNANSRTVSCSIYTSQTGSSPGAGTITVTLSGTEARADRVVMYVLEITGHDTTTPVGVTGNNGGTGSTLEVTMSGTPTSTSTVIAAVGAADDTTIDNIGVGTGFTELDEDNSAGSTATLTCNVMYDATSADSTADWSSLPTVNSCGVAIEIKAAATGATVALDPATATATAIALANVDAPVSRTMDTATGTVTGIALSVSAPPPGVTVALDTAAITATGIGCEIDAPITRVLDTASVIATGIPITLSVVGVVTVTLSTAALTATGVPLTISAPANVFTYTDGDGGNVNTAQDVNLHSTAHTFNNGLHSAIQFGDYNYGLIQFNLAAIPATSSVISAKLYLGLYEGAGNANIYAVLAANGGWIEGVGDFDLALEGEPCWDAKEADGAGGVQTAWAGGSNGCGVVGTDISSDTIGTLTAGSSGIFAVDLDADTVRGWFGASNTNYGILIKPTSTNANHIALAEYGTAVYRPKLVVLYEAAVVVGLDTAVITGTGIGLDVVPGAASVSLSTAAITASGVSLSVDAPVTRTLSTASLTGTPIPLTVSAISGVSVLLDTASITGTPVNAIVIEQVYVSLDTAILTVTGIGIDVVPGAVSIGLGTASLTALGIEITISALLPGQTISLDTATITGTGIGFDVVPGAVSIILGTASITVTGIDGFITTIGGTAVTLSTATVTVSATPIYCYSITDWVDLTLPERHLTFTLDRRDFASYITGAILTEAGDPILTEAGNRLETEASTESGSGFSLHERALTLTLEKKP